MLRVARVCAADSAAGERHAACLTPAHSAGGERRAAADLAPKAAPKQTTRKAPAPAPRTAPRAISPETAAKLSAVAHRAVPPPKTWAAAEAPAASGTEENPGDAVQLDPFFVQEDKPLTIRERDLLTPKGKVELARKLHPGLGVFPFNGFAAKEISEDEFQKIRNQKMRDLYGIEAMRRKDVPKDLKGKVDASQARQNQWLNEKVRGCVPTMMLAARLDYGLRQGNLAARCALI